MTRKKKETAPKCRVCKGYGRYWAIVACIPTSIVKCTACKGTGRVPSGCSRRERHMTPEMESKIIRSIFGEPDLPPDWMPPQRSN